MGTPQFPPRHGRSSWNYGKSGAGCNACPRKPARKLAVAVKFCRIPGLKDCSLFREFFANSCIERKAVAVTRAFRAAPI
jgi:hypothetical protein